MLRLLCALLFVEIVAGAVLTIPIRKVDTQSRVVKWNKRGYQLQDEPLYDFTKEYVGDAHFGTPPQHFRVLFDTGSANTWITDNWCECYGSCKTILCKLTCDAYCCVDRLVASNVPASLATSSANNNGFPYISRSVDVCEKKNKFDHKKSTTYVANGKAFSVTYGKRTVSGILGQDVFSLGEGGEGLTVPGVTFSQADTLSNEFQNDPIDGIIGLAFQSAAVDNVLPPLNQAIQDGLLDNAIFTIFLKPDNGDAPGTEAGRLTIGDLDGDNCGFIMAYEPLTAETLWQFSVPTVTIGGESASTGYTAISDSATSFVGLPQDLFNKAISAAQATYDKKNQFYKVDCNVNFGLSFTIGKREYSVDVQKLIYHVNDNVCQLLLFQTTNPDTNIVLGNPFNQQYCVVYDYSGRIGFAKPL